MTDKIEAMKKELAEKEARLAHIIEIIRSVDNLQKERRELSGSIWGVNDSNTGQIGWLRRRIAEAELREKASKMPEFHYFMWNGTKTRCHIESVGKKFISVISFDLIKNSFRVSDGFEKGSRIDGQYSARIDVSGAIEAFNKKASE